MFVQYKKLLVWSLILLLFYWDEFSCYSLTCLNCDWDGICLTSQQMSTCRVELILFGNSGSGSTRTSRMEKAKYRRSTIHMDK